MSGCDADSVISILEHTAVDGNAYGTKYYGRYHTSVAI